MEQRPLRRNDIVITKSRMGGHHIGRIVKRVSDRFVEVVWLEMGYHTLDVSLLSRVTSSYSERSKMSQTHSVHNFPTLRRLKQRYGNPCLNFR